MDAPTFRELSTAVAALSAMLTPALLILATGSILASTTSRLGRVIDRVRLLARGLEQLERSDPTPRDLDERRAHVLFLMQNAARRVRILQRAVTLLYLTVGGFVLTSVAIGLLELTRIDLGWLALLIGLVSAGLLLAASVLLIVESRGSLASIHAEMDFVLGKSRRAQAAAEN